MSSRTVTLLKHNWKFSRDFPENTQEIPPELLSNNFDDASWNVVSVPHDWAVEGEFSPDNDPQFVKVHADGILRETSHIGRTGGLPITGLGVYRCNFTVKDTTKRVFLEFDGVMSYSAVYVNGQKMGGHPYGYTSFHVDVTEALADHGENKLVVTANPKPSSSRWYTGAGIYRPVRLVEVQDAFVAFDGVYITSKLANHRGEVHVITDISGKVEDSSRKITQSIYAPNGILVAETTTKLSAKVETAFTIENPQVWDIVSTNLYELVTEITENDSVIDRYTSKFGIRTVEMSREHGFRLNGKQMKLQGMCLHHDMGAIGTATNVYALKRQLMLLKEMGVNAIRSTHNPSSRELLDLCDEMGFLVIAEAFDEWKLPKVPNGYAILFDEWAEIDLVALIQRDRNHPCVIMWSLGNEIRDQNDPDGKFTARFLNEISHREDPTRPTTFGINNPAKAIELGFCDEVDVIGFNYQAGNYEKYLKEHPDWIIYGSETESVVSSRGVYHYPVIPDYSTTPHPSGHFSSYDVTGAKWGYGTEREFAGQEQFPEVLGQFTWTGFDYLGEPTPFRNQWPSHVSYFGVFDLAGLPKDRYYAYLSRWKKEPVLHLLPHWNWDGYGKIDVHAYSNCHKVELFVNGNSKGTRVLNPDIWMSQEVEKCTELERYRFIWRDVPYESGELSAIGYDSVGNILKTEKIQTAGDPVQLVLLPEKTSIIPEEYAYIKVQILDEQGILCPNSSHKINFHVEGQGRYVASDSGDQCSTHKFSEPYCKAFSGQCVAIVEAGEQGIMNLTATAQGLSSATIHLEVKDIPLQ